MSATVSTVATSVHVAALTANTADTVNFTSGLSTILITNRGASDIYATFAVGSGTATTATVGGNNTMIIQAGNAKKISVVGNIGQVSLISTGTGAYSVEGYN